MEINSNFNNDESFVLKYNPNHNFSESGGYYSASIKALVDLAKEKGYFLCKEVSFTNLIFIKNEFKELIEEFDYKMVNLPMHQHGGKNLEKFLKI